MANTLTIDRADYIYISKANSINMVEIVNPDDLLVFANENNLFNVDSQADFAYTEPTVFNNKDVPSLQIKSNYETMQLFRRNEDLVETELELLKMSDNLNKYANMDCIAYEHPSGRLAIYFDTGNIYDENNTVIGTYNLNGELPEFCKVGNIIDVAGIGGFQVSSVLIDYDINKKVCVFEYVYNTGTVNTKCCSVYDIIHYDVYEHYFDLKSLADGYYDIYVKATNKDEVVVEFLSENLLVQSENEGSIAMYYSDDNDNKDIFYKYGFVNFLRVFYADISRYNKEDNELNVNDNSTSLINSTLNFGNKFFFEDLTTKQIDTLSLALSCKNVFISGLGYLKDSSIAIETIDNTNIGTLEASMLLTNKKLQLVERLPTDERFTSTYIYPQLFPLM